MIMRVLIFAFLLLAQIPVFSATFTDVSDAAFLIRDSQAWNEVVTAYNERAAIALYTEYDLYESGEGIQKGTSAMTTRGDFAFLQYQVFNMSAYGTDDYGWYIGTNMPSSATNFPVYKFREDLFAAAGLSNGFRRATNYLRATDDWTDYDDPMWSRAGNGYGNVQSGDIIGPWLIDDLQKVLAKMHIWVERALYIRWAASENRNNRFSGSASSTNWADAVSAIESAYLSSGSYSINTLPSARYSGNYINSLNRYDASALGYMNQLQWRKYLSNPSQTNALARFNSIGASLSFYAKSEINASSQFVEYIYDPQDTGLQSNVYARFDQQSIAPGGTNQAFYSSWLGEGFDLAPPNPTDPPLTGSGDPSYVQGFNISGSAILIQPSWSHTR